MENEVTVFLPAEVAKIAKSVSVEKREEVQVVLNQVFNGVSKMREQLDIVSVADENDKVNMKIANSIRLGVRQVRLDSEKVFDAKRSEVQQQMLGFKTEDALWLKAKQTMQILTKEIEENARWKEETKERFDKEQKELNIQQRILKVQKYSSEIQMSEFENMGDSAFELFLSSLERAYNEKIELELKAELERVEKEKAIELHQLRKTQILPYWNFIPFDNRDDDFSTYTETEWSDRFEFSKSEKEKQDLEIENQRIENERLKKEAEEKEKALELERRAAKEKQDSIEREAKKAREEAEAILKAEQDKARIEAQKAAEEKSKLESELKAKQEAELKAKQEAEAKILADQKLAEEAAKAPIKIRLTDWIDSMDIFAPVGLEDNEKAIDIHSKFESFKMWAKSEINKL